MVTSESAAFLPMSRFVVTPETTIADAIQLSSIKLFGTSIQKRAFEYALEAHDRRVLRLVQHISVLHEILGEIETSTIE